MITFRPLSLNYKLQEVEKQEWTEQQLQEPLIEATSPEGADADRVKEQ